MKCTCTAGDALDNQRRHRHGDGRCDVPEQLGAGSSGGTATTSSAQAPAPTSGMPLKLRIFAADVRCVDRHACPRATPPTRDSEAVRRIFSGVCHNVFRELWPVGRDSGSGGRDAAGLWGQIGGPTVLAVAVTRVGLGTRDRRDACRGAWDQLAGVEAAGTYAVEGGLIGNRTIISLEKIARGLIYRAEGAGSGPRSASWAESSRERARTRSAVATRPFADAAGVLTMVDTRTGRGVSTSPIRNLMRRGPTRSHAGRRRLHRGAGVLAEGRSGAPGRRPPDPACHRGLSRSRDAPGIG